MDKRKGNEGFSLVEVLISIAILAIVTLPILSIFTNAAKTNSKARRTENANTAANNIIEEIKNVSVSNLEIEDLNYSYQKESNQSFEDEQGVLKFLVSNNDKDSYTGIDGEDFIIEATLDPSYYNDNFTNGASNSKNNVNSFGLSSYASLDKEKNIIYTDDAINEEAATYFLESTGDLYDRSCIKKTSVIDVSITKDRTSSDFVSYIQKLDVTISYSYIDEARPDLNIADYIREFNYATKLITASNLDTKLEPDLSEDDYDYIISSSSDYENNANKIYIFYSIFDDYYADENVSIVDGQKKQYAKDEITINYSYDTSFNKKIAFLNLDLLFIEQEKQGDEGYVVLSNDKVTCNYYSDANKSLRENSSQKEVSKDLVVSIFSNVENWALSIENGIKSPGKNYIYRLIVKVYYRSREEENLLTTIVSTKIE